MTYRHIFIVRSVLITIRKEVGYAHFKETGGPLVGYVSDDQALVITHAAGPGPRAKLTPFSVLIDGEHAQQFCDKISLCTDGRIDYVGDWHRHLGRSLKASTDDLCAMQKMAAFEYCPIVNPVSLIYCRRPEAYVTYVLTEEGILDDFPNTLLKSLVL